MLENITDLAPLQELLDWRTLVYLAVSALILLAAKLANQLLAGYKLNQQITHVDNKAIAVSFAGFVLSVCIIISGVLNSPSSAEVDISSSSWWITDVGSTALWGVIGAAMLLTTRWFNDKFVLPKFSIKKELLEDKNVGVGAAQAGAYITTALIIRSSIAGADQYGLGMEIALSLVWFSISQILIFLFSKLYQKVVKFQFHEKLEQDNAAVGVAFAGSLVSFGLLLSFFINRCDGLLGLLIWALISATLLLIVRCLVDKLMLPSCKLDHEISEDANWGAAIIEVATSIGTALLIAGSFS